MFSACSSSALDALATFSKGHRDSSYKVDLLVILEKDSVPQHYGMFDAYDRNEAS
jgi:hypothetical protein